MNIANAPLPIQLMEMLDLSMNIHSVYAPVEGELADFVSTLDKSYAKVRETCEKQGLFKTMIVKVQRPLASNKKDPEALVYNEDHSLTCFMPMEDAIDFFEPEDAKVYCVARLWSLPETKDLAGQLLQLVALAPPQDW